MAVVNKVLIAGGAFKEQTGDLWHGLKKGEKKKVKATKLIKLFIDCLLHWVASDCVASISTHAVYSPNVTETNENSLTWVFSLTIVQSELLRWVLIAHLKLELQGFYQDVHMHGVQSLGNWVTVRSGPVCMNLFLPYQDFILSKYLLLK